MRALPPISERTFTHAFKRAIDDVPDKAAYIDADGVELTYAQTMDRALRAGTAFAALGVEEEQYVALMLDNSVEFITAVYGLGLTRRVPVTVRKSGREARRERGGQYG